MTTSFDQNGQVRAALRRVYREHGREGLDQVDVVAVALPGDTGDERLARAAAEAGVASLLDAQISVGLEIDAAIHAVVLRLHRRSGLQLIGCDWIVYEYALAVGLVSEYPTISGGLPEVEAVDRARVPSSPTAVVPKAERHGGFDEFGNPVGRGLDLGADDDVRAEPGAELSEKSLDRPSERVEDTEKARRDEAPGAWPQPSPQIAPEVQPPSLPPSQRPAAEPSAPGGYPGMPASSPAYTQGAYPDMPAAWPAAQPGGGQASPAPSDGYASAPYQGSPYPGAPGAPAQPGYASPAGAATSPQGSASPAQEVVKREMRRGVLAVNAADRMHQGRKERVEVGIARTSESAPEMVASLTAQPRLSAEVNTADYMQLQLVGDGFAITPLSPPQQLVVPTARWDFDVVPLAGGSQQLSVIGTCWFTVDGQERAMAVPAFVRMVEVEVDNGYRVKRWMAANWQWVIGTILGLGGAIAGWIALFG